jgi:hypothetical protein
MFVLYENRPQDPLRLHLLFLERLEGSDMGYGSQLSWRLRRSLLLVKH